MPASATARSPKVSVCMLAFNHEQFLHQAIESALAQQTEFPFEIVIGEDGSTDQTPEIVRGFADRHPQQVRALIREQNLGIRDNFRETLAACRGQFVAILEGDDYWTDPLKLQRQVDALETHSDWAVCFHRVQVEHSDGRPAEREPAEDDFPTVTRLGDLLRRNFICTPSVMFRHRLFTDWPDEFATLLQQDWPLHVLNAQHGDIGYLPEVMAVYRKHAGGAWTAKSLAARTQWGLEAEDAFEDLLGQEYSADIRIGRRRMAVQLSEALDEVLQSRDLRWGRTLLKPIRKLRRLLSGDATT